MSPAWGELTSLAFGCPGVLAVLGLEAAAPGECELTRLLQDKLQYEMRLRYMVTPGPEGTRGHGALRGLGLLGGEHGTVASAMTGCWVGVCTCVFWFFSYWGRLVANWCISRG